MAEIISHDVSSASSMVGAANDPDSLIRPTVFVGLGGTGQKVLLRLRKLFFEQYQRKSLPFTEFFCFDTDEASVLPNTQPWLSRQIQLDAHEKLIQELSSGTIINRYYQNPGAYRHIVYTDRENTPDAWFDLNEMKKVHLGAVDAGAGQVRPFGRLAFHAHFPQIHQSLRAIEQRLSRSTLADEAKAEPFGFSQLQTNKREVVIVASLAGGTGSGCLLDFAFLVNHVFKDDMVTAILFLPGAFSGNAQLQTDEVLANGYAALREIEHYMSPATLGRHNGVFTFNWDGTPRKINGQPFKCIYLMDGRNQVGSAFDVDDAYDMAAEYLALNFDKHGFGQQKRSNRSNIFASLGTKWAYEVKEGHNTYTQTFPAHYSTFGLSQVKTDQAKMSNAAASRLGMMLIDWWLQENRPTAEFEAHEFPKLLSGLNLNQHALIDALLGVVNPQRFRTQIADQVESLSQQAQGKCEEFNKNSSLPLAQLHTQVEPFAIRLEETLRQQREQIDQDLQTGARQYGDTATMGKKAEALIESISATLKRSTLDYLIDPRKYGVIFAREVIKLLAQEMGRLTHLVTQERAALEDKIREFEAGLQLDPPSLQPYEKWHERHLAAQGLSRVAPLVFSTREWAISYTRTRLAKARGQILAHHKQVIDAHFQAKARDLQTYAEKRFRLEALHLIHNPAKTGILDKLLEYLDASATLGPSDGSQGVKVTVHGLAYGLNTYQEKLKELQGEFKTRFDSFSQANSANSRNILLSARTGYVEDLLSMFREEYSAKDEAEVYEALSADFFRQHHLLDPQHLESRVVSLAHEGVRQLYERASGSERNMLVWQDVKTKLELFVGEATRDFKQDLRAWDEFSRQFTTEAERRQKLEHVIKAATPRLQLLQTDSTNGHRIMEKPLIGVSPDTGDSRRVLSEIQQTPLPGKLQNPFGLLDKTAAISSDRVLFYCETAIFPLSNVLGVQELERAYERQVRNSYDQDLLAHRHTVVNRDDLPEILDPGNQEAAMRRLEAFRTLVLSLCLGVATYDSERSEIQMIVQRDLLRSTRTLGRTIKSATRTLDMQQDWLSQLKVDIASRLNSLYFNAELSWTYLLLLAYLSNTAFPENPDPRGKEGERSIHNALFHRLFVEHRKQLQHEQQYTDDEMARMLNYRKDNGELETSTYVAIAEDEVLFAPLRAMRFA